MGAALPEAFGRYRVEAEIGRGGMGVVYRARDAGGATVALKVLDSTLDEADRRFAREVAIRIDHPNVVRVLDSGEQDGRPYLVLELLVGETLTERLRRGPLSVRAAVELAVQLCRGLEAIHAAGIVHRDLKPNNVLITEGGVAKLIDFGIAHLPGSELTRSNLILGTPTYLSPEQVVGRRDLDGRSDLFSLGSLLYTTLTGRPPFQRASAVATMFAVASEEAPPASSRVGGISTELDRVVATALAKERTARFASALELRRALERLDLTTSKGQPRAPSGGDKETRVVAVLLAQGVRDRARLEAAVLSRQGRLVSLLGGRSVAVYGEHTREGDETERAVLSALEAEGAAECLAIASGRAVIEAYGIEEVPIEEAERLAAVGRSGVIISAREAEALGVEFRFEPILGIGQGGSGPILGIGQGGSGPILGIGPEPIGAGARRVTARAARRAPPYAPVLGRDPILAQLRDLLERSLEEGTAAGALLVGPAGIGKSALVHAMERAFEASGGTRSLFGRTHSHRRGLSLSLFASAVPPAAIPELAAAAFHSKESIADASAFLSALLERDPPETSGLRAARNDPRLMADRLRLTLLDLFAGLRAQGPVALFLEDLQWADPESLELLRDLVVRPGGPLFVVATARPELRQLTGLTTVEVGGLRRRDVGLLAKRIAGRELAQPLMDAIAERTAGNPLFIEHTVRELSARALLDSPSERLPLPITVEAAVQSRLDALPKVLKECLKQASIYRGPFARDAVVALGIGAPGDALEALVDANLLLPQPGEAGEPSYRFASELVAEVADRMLTREHRELLHARAAAHLGAASAASEEIALHHEAGNEPERAARAYAAAARSAAARGDSRAVVTLSDRALTLAERAVPVHQVQLLRADALQFLGRREEAYAAIEAALGAARTKAERARAMAERAWWLHRTGRHAEALVAAELAVTAARRAKDREVLALALGRKMLALIHAGRLEKAEASLAEASACVGGGSLQLKAMAAGWRAQLATAKGDLGARLAAFEQAAALYLEAGDVRRAAGARVNLADAHNRFGAYGAAVRGLEGALEDCRRVGHRSMEGYALMNLGYARSRLGERDAALEALEAAMQIAAETKEARLDVFVRTYRARGRLGIAAPAEVLAEAELAARDAVARGQTMIAAVAYTVAAQAALAADQIEAALASSERAYTLMKSLGSMEEGEAEAYLVRAAALARADRALEADAIREEGRSALVERAESITDLALRSAFFTAVSAHRELMYNR